MRGCHKPDTKRWMYGLLVLPALILNCIGTLSAQAEPSLVNLAPSAEPESQNALMFTPGTPSATSAARIKPSGVLTWTATGTMAIEDTYDIRVSSSSNTSDDQLNADRGRFDGLNVREFAPNLLEGEYYWQVRSCTPMTQTCNAWSPVWKVTVDGTAPVVPTISLKSGPHNTTVSVAGTAEAGSTIRATSNGATCTDVASADGAWSCTFNATFNYGTYELAAHATDDAGNQGQDEVTSITISELFVVESITAKDLPTTLDVQPITATPKNQVGVSSSAVTRVDLNTGLADASGNDAANSPISADGGIIQSSQTGWQVLGIPWYFWIGGAVGASGGLWMFGAASMRLLNRSSPA